MEKITENLINWYHKNKRDLPWRKTNNSYFIWVSEIMLQQTRVETVKVYFERFIKRLPTLKDLAFVQEDELLKLWEGLGYYSRVRNMQKTAQILVRDGSDTLPCTRRELLELPGIGEYTAGAILSIAYQQPSVAIDGNVYRVLGRYYAIEESISKSSGYKIYESYLKKILPEKFAGDFTQSFMDLGSMVCLPKNPRCEICPLKSDCQARVQEAWELYPIKEKKKKQRVEQRSVFIFKFQDKIAIRKRESSGLLASLYEIPNVLSFLSPSSILKTLTEQNFSCSSVKEVGESKHVFSHVIWKMHWFLIEIQNPSNDFLWVTVKNLKGKYSLPSAFSYVFSILEDR